MHRYHIIPFPCVYTNTEIHTLIIARDKTRKPACVLHNKRRAALSTIYIVCITQLYLAMMVRGIHSLAIPLCSQSHMLGFIACCLSSEKCGCNLKLNTELSPAV